MAIETVIASVEAGARAMDATTRFIGLLGQLSNQKNEVKVLHEAAVAGSVFTRDGGVILIFDGYVDGPKDERTLSAVPIHLTKDELPNVARYITNLAKMSAEMSQASADEAKEKLRR